MLSKQLQGHPQPKHKIHPMAPARMLQLGLFSNLLIHYGAGHHGCGGQIAIALECIVPKVHENRPVISLQERHSLLPELHVSETQLDKDSYKTAGNYTLVNC